MIGREARADGFNVLLGGSVNLMREPRNGRNFEYAGEDPLLAGTMAGAAIGKHAFLPNGRRLAALARDARPDWQRCVSPLR